MIRIKGKFYNRAHVKENFLKKFDSIHKEHYQSEVEEIFTNSFQEDVNQTLKPDNNNINVNETSHNVVIAQGEIFQYINNKIPPSKEVTSLMLETVHTFKIFDDPVLKELESKTNFFDFFNKLLSGFYEAELNQNISINLKEFRDYYNEKYKITHESTNFYISIKDYLGNEFYRSEVTNIGKITEKVISEMRCPVNDTTTTEKDGFNINDTFYLYYKNTFYNIEFPVNYDISLGNNTIQDKGQTVIKDLRSDQKFLKELNPQYYSILAGNR